MRILGRILGIPGRPRRLSQVWPDKGKLNGSPCALKHPLCTMPGNRARGHRAAAPTRTRPWQPCAASPRPRRRARTSAGGAGRRESRRSRLRAVAGRPRVSCRCRANGCIADELRAFGALGGTVLARKRWSAKTEQRSTNECIGVTHGRLALPGDKLSIDIGGVGAGGMRADRQMSASFPMYGCRDNRNNPKVMVLSVLPNRVRAPGPCEKNGSSRSCDSAGLAACRFSSNSGVECARI